ncbi:MAG: hypothetical protein RL556_201 [Actinomycetota bacterium]
MAAALALTACTPQTAPNKSASPSATETPVNLSAYYSQKLSWKKCGTHLKCSKVSAPLDYADLSQGSIKLAIVRYSNTKNKALGQLVMNPGGPGASGYDFVKNSVTEIGTDRLRAHYNIVGFDPRGVQHSTAVHCLSAKQMDSFFYDASGYAIGSPEDLAHSRTQAQIFGAACAKNTGKLLAHVDTESAAKDLDIIRAALGQPKLDYLGFSYGTYLGTVYAAMFPTMVGHFVLDGAIDPNASGDDQSVHQLVGFDLALKNYLKYCLSNTDCPFSGSLEKAQKKVQSFLLSTETKPLKNKDEPNRKATVWAVETGMMMALYSNDYWTYLTDAFKEAFKNKNGANFMRLADFYNDRGTDGKYLSNINEANIAISCVDSREPATPEALAAQNAKLLAASPTLGRYWLNGAVLCDKWPYPAVHTITDFSAKGSPRILVIGTTGDPATPYEQAVSLAHNVLANGYLLTYQGEGHTAYGRSNSCVSNSVDDFYLSATLPATEPRC